MLERENEDLENTIRLQENSIRVLNEERANVAR
jgi:hypothetical protein